MSVIVKINQNNKRINKETLQMLLMEEKLCYGIFDEAFILNNYDGKKDIRNQLLVIYDKKKVGRGFSLNVDEEFNIEVILNQPSTNNDIKIFYNYIKRMCNYLKKEKFVQDEVEQQVKNINLLLEEMIVTNQKLIKHDLKENETIFGAYFPLIIENKFLKEISTMNEKAAAIHFEEYLNLKQSIRYYYAKPILYQDKLTNEIDAYYTLTEGVETIFPIKPSIPFSYDLPKDIEIKKWTISIIKHNLLGYKQVGEIDFDSFKKIFCHDDYEMFDEDHIIIKINKNDIDKINRYLVGDIND